MAVAVKNSPEAGSRHAVNKLAVSSLAGTAYVLVSLALVFKVLPALWAQTVSRAFGSEKILAVDQSLRYLAMLALAAVLVVLAKRLIGPNPARGFRAGVFTGVVGVFVVGWITRIVGGILEQVFTGNSALLGAVLTGLVGAALLVGLIVLFFRQRFDDRVVALEDQGWFTATAYKRSQGLRVRRGTILGILILAGAGIWTLFSRDVLKSGASPNWGVTIPFTDGKVLTLLPDIQFTVPILLSFLAVWLAYRAVNLPVFSDFLIATEAEMNKVSWTTRRRLVQDTVVVLVTVILLTLFLFVVDVVWFQLLSNRWVQVIQSSPTAEKAQVTQEEW